MVFRTLSFALLLIVFSMSATEAAKRKAANDVMPADARQSDYWRLAVNRFDLGRLERYDRAWRKAWEEAQKEDKDGFLYDEMAIRLAGSLWTMPRQQFHEDPMAGNYRCRFIQVGGFLTVKYEWFGCLIVKKNGGVFFDKTGGSQRTSGRLYPRDANSMVYVGAGYFPHGNESRRKKTSYDRHEPHDPTCYNYNNEVGILSKIEDGHFIIGFPEPACGSKFDIIEVAR